MILVLLQIIIPRTSPLPKHHIYFPSICNSLSQYSETLQKFVSARFQRLSQTFCFTLLTGLFQWLMPPYVQFHLICLKCFRNLKIKLRIAIASLQQARYFHSETYKTKLGLYFPFSSTSNSIFLTKSILTFPCCAQNYLCLKKKRKKKVLSKEANANMLSSKTAEPQNQHEPNFVV